MTDGPGAIEPTDEHHWLARLVGDWTYVSGEGESRAEGTETVRMLGDLWAVAEGEGTMVGGRYLCAIGFNPATGRFVGQWIGDMMAHPWVYDGELSSDGRSLYLMSEGPAFDGSDRLQAYRDTYEIISDDERLQRGAYQDENGQWIDMYVAAYRRKRTA